MFFKRKWKRLCSPEVRWTLKKIFFEKEKLNMVNIKSDQMQCGDRETVAGDPSVEQGHGDGGLPGQRASRRMLGGLGVGFQFGLDRTIPSVTFL